MTKFIAISLICAFAFNFSPSIQAADFATGALSQLAGAGITRGIADPLLEGLVNGVTKLACQLLRPGLVTLVSETKRCSGKSAQLDDIKDLQTYCKRLREGGPELRKCVPNSIVSGDINLIGLANLRGQLGDCCGIPEFSKNKIGGQLVYNLVSGEIENKGSAGKVVYKAVNALKNLACSYLGRGLLELFRNQKKCLKGTTLPKNKSFCDIYNSASALIKKCLNESVIELLVNLGPVGKGGINVAECCSGKKPKNPPSACQSTPCKST